MNEQHITPKGSAFPARAALPQPEQAAEAAAQEAARAATREFATHGDPSLGKDEPGESTEPEDRRVRVRWERPTDVAMRAAAASLGKGADLHLMAHTRIRALHAQARQSTTAQVRRLPAAVMARRATGPDSPGSDPVSR